VLSIWYCHNSFCCLHHHLTFHLNTWMLFAFLANYLVIESIEVACWEWLCKYVSKLILWPYRLDVNSVLHIVLNKIQNLIFMCFVQGLILGIVAINFALILSLNTWHFTLFFHWAILFPCCPFDQSNLIMWIVVLPQSCWEPFQSELPCPCDLTSGTSVDLPFFGNFPRGSVEPCRHSALPCTSAIILYQCISWGMAHIKSSTCTPFRTDASVNLLYHCFEKLFLFWLYECLMPVHGVTCLTYHGDGVIWFCQQHCRVNVKAFLILLWGEFHGHWTGLVGPCLFDAFGHLPEGHTISRSPWFGHGAHSTETTILPFTSWSCCQCTCCLIVGCGIWCCLISCILCYSSIIICSSP